MATPPARGAFMGVESDSRKRLRLSVNSNYESNAAGGWNVNARLNLRFIPPTIQREGEQSGASREGRAERRELVGVQGSSTIQYWLASRSSEVTRDSPPSPLCGFGGAAFAWIMSEGWCERGDSNPHGIATASPSSFREG
jgi:hypothetical protein